MHPQEALSEAVSLQTMHQNITAFLWGFAEATLFLYRTGCILTYRALRGYNQRLISRLYAVAGALAGAQRCMSGRSIALQPYNSSNIFQE